MNSEVCSAKCKNTPCLSVDGGSLLIGSHVLKNPGCGEDQLDLRLKEIK